MTGGQLQGLEAAACALSQQCGWWHSTEEGFTGPGIRESASTSLGKVFRGCVEMCKLYTDAVEICNSTTSQQFVLDYEKLK